MVQVLQTEFSMQRCSGFLYDSISALILPGKCISFVKGALNCLQKSASFESWKLHDLSISLQFKTLLRSYHFPLFVKVLQFSNIFETCFTTLRCIIYGKEHLFTWRIVNWILYSSYFKFLFETFFTFFSIIGHLVWF